MVHQKHNSDRQEIQQGPLVRAFMHPMVQRIRRLFSNNSSDHQINE